MRATSWRRTLSTAAAATLAASVAGCSEDPQSTSGPLPPPKSHFATTTRQVGVPFTDGFETIVIPDGVTRLRLLSVEAVGDPDLELIGWKIADDRRRFGSIQFMPWPPRDDLLAPESIVDGPGYSVRVTPELRESGLELLLGMRPTSTGYLERRGLRLTYEADGERHRVFFDAGLYVCAEPDPVPQARTSECPDPQDVGREPHMGPG
ncbi:hypothetical protein KLP28_00765 [Nocardioidaceae bacterium]|nr:hypothetical protein KLP28_00765 [Nocardioidaceae bacterium]